MAEQPRAEALLQKNVRLVEGIRDILGSYAGDWSVLKSKFSTDHVKRIYALVDDVWPPCADIFATLPEPGPGLRALFLGFYEPDTILQSVMRYSLYTDQIFLVNPFWPTHCMRPGVGPIESPITWLEDTFKNVGIILLLEPWIRDGLVQLIPDPRKFDPMFEREMSRLANLREAFRKLQGGPDTSDMGPVVRRHFARVVARLPAEKRWTAIDDDKWMIPTSERRAFLAHCNGVRTTDPFCLDREREDGEEQAVFFRMGMKLEPALIVAEQIGAYPYTDVRERWRELLASAVLPREASPWTPLTQAFQRLTFPFLNNVDLRFAHAIRQDGRLESLRALLRRIWEVSKAGATVDLEGSARIFCDELTAEYRKAQAEWEQIRIDLAKWTSDQWPKAALAVVASLGVEAVAPIQSGLLQCVMPIAGFGLPLASHFLTLKKAQRAFRLRVPLAVFIDLAKC